MFWLLPICVARTLTGSVRATYFAWMNNIATNTKSAHAALSYALGDGKAKLKNDTIDWLESRGVDTSTITRREVVMSGTNAIVPELASSKMKAVRVAFVADDFYKSMSVHAKYLYGILRDRFELSLINGWVDDNDALYIYFTIDEIK